MTEWLEILAKLVVYSAALLVIGAVTLRAVLAPSAELDAAARRAVIAGSVRVLRMSSWLLLVGLLARAWAHTAAAFGFSESFAWSNLEIVVFESRWGGGWRLQLGAALLLTAAAAWARHEWLALRSIVVTAAGLVGVALPLTGHAATATTNWLVHSVHVLGAGAWVGTLVCIVLLPDTDERRLHPELLRAFAPAAATGAGLILASGLWAAWTYVGPLANLWGTEYGRLLDAKVGVVCGVGLLGAVNWRRLRRSEAAGMRATVFTEAALAAVVVLLTAWLTETAHP